MVNMFTNFNKSIKLRSLQENQRGAFDNAYFCGDIEKMPDKIQKIIFVILANRKRKYITTF